MIVKSSKLIASEIASKIVENYNDFGKNLNRLLAVGVAGKESEGLPNISADEIKQALGDETLNRIIKTLNTF